LKSEAAQWLEPQPAGFTDDLLHAAGGDRILAEALARRGIETIEQAAAFLDPHKYQPAPPSDLPDLDQAVERLSAAIDRAEHIGIWGDFDVDGQTSTTVLYSALQALGAKVSYYIPVRARESHGITTAGLQAFLDRGVELLLTCDTGISAHAEVEFARGRGVDVLITDHHTLPPELPQARAVVNPQRLPEDHPLNPLCGVGTAYKLVEALFDHYGKPKDALQYLDLVAIGTVADLARLTGENRYFVQQGLALIRRNPRPAIQVILDLAGINHSQFSEEHISYILAPRLNALGRLADANPAVPFLLCQDLAEAKTLALQTEALNTQRKLLCDQVFQAAQSQLEQDPAILRDPIMVLSHPEWPAGVIGIAASRLVELYNRPVILVSSPPGSPGRGSARSVEGINITAALEKNQHLLNTFGGHPMAAGFSIDADKILQFRQAINRDIQDLVEERPTVRQIVLEAYLPLESLTLDLVETLDRLSPFGPGNPPLVLATRNLVIRNFSPIGKGGEHLQIIVEDPSGASRKVIWWQGAGFPLPEERFDLAYSVRASNYRGERSVQVEWINARPVKDEVVARVRHNQIEVIDLRKAPDPLMALEEIRKSKECIVWQEGEKVNGVTGFDRFHLKPSPGLVIWNVPPGLSELRNLLTEVQPQQVVMIGVPSAVDQPDAFLTRLAGLIRFIINKRQGRTSIRDLAALTNQREATVRKGIEWWCARGEISYSEEPELSFSLKKCEAKDLAALTAIETDIVSLLQETAAFRSYFMRANTDQLIE